MTTTRIHLVMKETEENPCFAVKTKEVAQECVDILNLECKDNWRSLYGPYGLLSLDLVETVEEMDWIL